MSPPTLTPSSNGRGGRSRHFPRRAARWWCCTSPPGGKRPVRQRALPRSRPEFPISDFSSQVREQLSAQLTCGPATCADARSRPQRAQLSFHTEEDFKWSVYHTEQLTPSHKNVPAL